MRFSTDLVLDRSLSLMAPPVVQCEFLLFLSKAEAAARNDASNPFLDSEEEDEILKAKVRAYIAALSKRLSCWAQLGCSAEEHYRSRIEELMPTLERTLERRQNMAQSSPVTHAAGVLESLPQQRGASADVAGDLTLGGAACVAQEPVEAPAHMPDGSGDVSPLAVETSDTRSPQNTASEHGRTPVNAAELPWRRSSARSAAAFPRRSSGFANGSAMRNELEKDMLQDIEGMKGAANSFLVTLRKDNQNLKKIQDTQDSSLQKVNQETQKGKKMMRSGQIGFLCTMVMLIVSVIIFFMMIPFIIFT